MQKQTNKDGVPKIADQESIFRKKLFLIFAVVLMILGAFYLNNKSSQKKPNEAVEEIYTIQKEENAIGTKETTSPAEPKSVLTQQEVSFLHEKQKELQQRLSAPLMIIHDKNDLQDKSENSESKFASSDKNTLFLQQVSAMKNADAKAIGIGALNTIIAEGNLIHAILENSINSDLPGPIRGIVSQSVYSEDGSQILIPRGSRLIGQYKSGMEQGQSRIFVVWTRLLTPNGFSIQLGSLGVDEIGTTGMSYDAINRHFWSRFGTASLLSIIGSGAANVSAKSDTENSINEYRTGLANSFAQAADQSLQQQGNIPPTIQIYQGKPIIVFVAKDLHFESAINKTKSNINIF